MKRHMLSLSLIASMAAGSAQAACYADYKAKQEGGQLRLHYGVVQVSDEACKNRAQAERQVRRKLESAGWSLLTVVSVFDESGLDRRRESAAQFFLRF